MRAPKDFTLDDAKRWAKSLFKAQDRLGRGPWKLAQCQEAVAGMLGVGGWNQLSALFGEKAPQEAGDHMAYIYRLLEEAKKANARGIFIEVGRESAKSFFEIQGKKTIHAEMARGYTLEVLSVLYNVMGESKSVCYFSNRALRAIVNVDNELGAFSIRFIQVPTEEGPRVHLEIFPYGESRLEYCPSFVNWNEAQEAAGVLRPVSFHALTRSGPRLAMEAMAILHLQSGREVVAITDRAWPQLERRKGLSVSVLPHAESASDSEALYLREQLEMTLEAVQYQNVVLLLDHAHGWDGEAPELWLERPFPTYVSAGMRSARQVDMLLMLKTAGWDAEIDGEGKLMLTRQGPEVL